MSSTNKESSAGHGSKPTYVKKLNFEQKLGPNLAVYQPHVIVENNNLDNSLSVDKTLLVSDWLRDNKDNFCEKDNLIYPSSPVLDTSFITRTPRSPIIGNCKKRPRRTHSSRDSANETGNSNLDVDHLKRKNASLNSTYFSSEIEQSGPRVQRSQENIQQLSILKSPSSVNKSPVLSDKVRLRKLRQRRLSEVKSKAGSKKLDNSLKSHKCLKSEKIVIIEDTLDEKYEFEEREIIQQEKIEDETFYEEDKAEEEEVKESLNESLTIEDCVTQFSNFKSKKKENLYIRKSVKVFVDDESIFIEEDTESEESESIVIEDVSTQDLDLVNNIKDVPVTSKGKIPVPVHSPSKDSDETYFSGAGSCQFQNRQPSSQKISEVSSSKIKPDSLDRVNQAISTETASPEPVIQSYFNIMRTEKKKRRLKKCSLATKLQTLVSRETSYLRMWYHQMSKRAFRDENVHFVELYVQRYYTYSKRQFAECCLINDSYNLLKNIINLQTEPVLDSQTVDTKKSVNRTITVMSVPQILDGLIEKRGRHLKIFPPWEILDQENITLCVKYFTVDKEVEFEINDEKISESVQSKIIEKFDCPCIQEGKVVGDCSLRFGNKKPNVIQEIFNISSKLLRREPVKL